MGHKQAIRACIQAMDGQFLDDQFLDDQFLAVLRHALNHLYDHEQLRASALIGLLELEGQQQAPLRLQQLLLEAIEALRPATSEPAGSMKRRIHQVLQLRYAQQFAQKEVAVQLGLSVRQFRRLQQVAVESLALHLTERHALAERLASLPAAHPTDAGTPAAAALPESLHWILSLSRTENTVLDRALPEVLRLVQPLAERNQKRLVWGSEDCAEGCTVAVHPLVFRQAMLHLLNAAILHTGGSEVRVSVAGERLHVNVAVQAGCALAGAGGDPPGLGAEEQIVQQMLGAFDASLCVAPCGSGWQAVLRCDRVQEQPVLVIDDHPDTVDLLKRCVEGTRYRVVATHEPQAALDLAQKEEPFIVLLDVMMPGVDGWEVLTRLKQHEATAALPVWVCTVLDQSELALSLGADGFLRKPFTREALLAVLDAQAAQEPAGS